MSTIQMTFDRNGSIQLLAFSFDFQTPGIIWNLNIANLLYFTSETLNATLQRWKSDWPEIMAYHRTFMLQTTPSYVWVHVTSSTYFFSCETMTVSLLLWEKKTSPIKPWTGNSLTCCGWLGFIATKGIFIFITNTMLWCTWLSPHWTGYTVRRKGNLLL